MVLIKKWVRECGGLACSRYKTLSVQYAGWSEAQRWCLQEHILRQLSDDQLLLIHSLLDPTLPPPDQDFTRLLPRWLCLRIFSLLDPQSLCRAAQVRGEPERSCWHDFWKGLACETSVWLGTIASYTLYIATGSIAIDIRFAGIGSI